MGPQILLGRFKHAGLNELIHLLNALDKRLRLIIIGVLPARIKPSLVFTGSDHPRYQWHYGCAKRSG
jgi:hypothetical protein